MASDASHPDQQYSDGELVSICRQAQEAEITIPELVQYVKAREQRLLDRIGEPTLESFPYTPTPEEYKKMCDVIKWYKDRVAAIRSKL